MLEKSSLTETLNSQLNTHRITNDLFFNEWDFGRGQHHISKPLALHARLAKSIVKSVHTMKHDAIG